MKQTETYLGPIAPFDKRETARKYEASIKGKTIEVYVDMLQNMISIDGDYFFYEQYSKNHPDFYSVLCDLETKYAPASKEEVESASKQKHKNHGEIYYDEIYGVYQVYESDDFNDLYMAVNKNKPVSETRTIGQLFTEGTNEVTVENIKIRKLVCNGINIYLAKKAD